MINIIDNNKINISKGTMKCMKIFSRLQNKIMIIIKIGFLKI
jgi:hypothetical protein